jgi:hypothetical protein
MLINLASGCRECECTSTPFHSFYLLHSIYPAHSTPSPTKISRDSYLSSSISQLLFVSSQFVLCLYVSRWKVAAAFCKLHIFLYALCIALCIALSPHSAGNLLKAFISYCLLINSRTSNISVYRGKNRNCPEAYYTVENQKPNSWTYNFVEISGYNLESYQNWGFCIQRLHHTPNSNHFFSGCGGGGGVKSGIRGDCE